MDENFAYLPQWDDSDSASYEVGVVQRLTAIKEPNNQSVEVKKSVPMPVVAPRESHATAAMLSPISYKVVTGNKANNILRDNELNYSNHIHETNQNKSNHKSVLHPTSDNSRNVVDDVSLNYRELVLYNVKRINALIPLLDNINKSIVNNGVIDQNSIYSPSGFVINGVLPPNVATGINTPSNNTTLTKEGNTFDDTLSTLELYIFNTIKNAHECMNSRMEMYLTQSKKMRELSNVAIRNTVLAEKQEAQRIIQRLKHDHNIEKEKLSKQNNDLINESKLLQNIISDLKFSLQAANDSTKLMIEEEVNRRRSLWDIEQNQLVNNMTVEKEQLRQDYANNLKAIEHTHAELKIKLENEVANLKSEIKNQTILLQKQKEEYESLRNEDKLAYQREINHLQAEHVQSQSMVKSSLTQQLSLVKQEDERRMKGLENILMKERENQTKVFQIESERMHDKYRTDLKKLKATLESDYRTEVAKLKHFHEQELNRLLNENDRLKRIASRSTNVTALSHRSSATANPSIKNTNDSKKKVSSNEHQGKIKSSYSIIYDPVESDNAHNIHDPEPSPPPPPPSSVKILPYTSDISAPRSGGSNSWGALKESLLLQESGSIFPESSKVSSDESSTPESSMLSHNDDTYSKKLQKYIENTSSNSVFDQDVSSDDSV